MTTIPSASAQTWPGASSSDLKPSARATSTTPAKIRKLRSRSAFAVDAAGTTLSCDAGGSFIEPGSLLWSSAVAVFQPHHIFDLGRGDLDDVGILNRRQPVPGSGRDVQGVAFSQTVSRQPAVRAAELHVDLPSQQVLELVFPLVVLERKRLSPVHVQDLSDVALGDRPVQLVAPRLVDPFPFDPAELRTHRRAA